MLVFQKPLTSFASIYFQFVNKKMFNLKAKEKDGKIKTDANIYPLLLNISLLSSKWDFKILIVEGTINLTSSV